MPKSDIITLQCAPGMRTNGEVVSGVVNLNLRLAHEELRVVMVSLHGEVNTDVYVDSRQGSQIYHEAVWLLHKRIVLWEPGALLSPDMASSEVASFPFSFTLPLDNLPPSFAYGGANAAGYVKYYVRVFAERKVWYRRNVGINRAFPFLPLDHSDAPHLTLPEWPGAFRSFRASKGLRTGIFHGGEVEIEFKMPQVDRIPLFRPIPVHLHIICSSKRLPASAANDVSKFKFPRNPKTKDCKITLEESYQVSAQGETRVCGRNYGMQGEFGKKGGNRIQVKLGEPHWVVDVYDKQKGCWQEDVTYSSTIVFRRPPPFSVNILSTSVSLIVEVDFPGLLNKVKLNTYSLRLSSGKAPPGASQNQQNRGTTSPSSSEANDSRLEELDLLPSYYDVMQMKD